MTLRGSLKNSIFRRGNSRKTNIQGGLPEKGGLGQFTDLRGALQERGGGLFLRGVDTPMQAMTTFLKIFRTYF